MEDFLVTFIVPTIKKFENIQVILRDIINSGIYKFELIIVNDNSRDSFIDNSEVYFDICDDAKKRNGEIHIINNSRNVGPGASRNVALEKARGLYLSFVDDDDNIFPNVIKWLNRENIKNADIVALDFEDSLSVFSNKNILERLPEGELINSEELIEVILEGERFPWQCQPYFFKKSFLDFHEIRFPETFVGEDVAFDALAFLYAENVICFRGPYYYYNSRPGTLKSSNGLDRSVDLLVASIHIQTYFYSNHFLDNRQEKRTFFQKTIEFLSFLFTVRLISSNVSDDIESDIFTKIENRVDCSPGLLWKIRNLPLADYKSKICDMINFDAEISFSRLIAIRQESILAKLMPFVYGAENIFVYCAGPFGRSMAHLLSNNLKTSSVSFIDDNADLFKDRLVDGFPISTLNEIVTKSDICPPIIIVCNPQPWLEEKIIENVTRRLGEKWADLNRSNIIPATGYYR